MVNQRTDPRRESFRQFADRLAFDVSDGRARLNPNDPDADLKFSGFLDQKAKEIEAATGTPKQDTFRSIFDKTIGRAAGAAGRGALGAGRFVQGGAEAAADPIARQIRDITGQLSGIDSSDPRLNDRQREVARSAEGLARLGNAVDQASAASAGATTESIIAPVAGQRGLGQAQRLDIDPRAIATGGQAIRGVGTSQPNQFDQFIADLERRRATASVLDALTLAPQRGAFREDENINPAIKLGIEAVSDVTNFVPVGRIAGGVRSADRLADAARGSGRVTDVAQTGSLGRRNAREVGEALADRNAQRQAENAREVIPFGPNRTTEGIPGGIPEGAADDLTPEQAFEAEVTRAREALRSRNEPVEQVSRLATQPARENSTVVSLPSGVDEIAAQAEATDGVVSKLTEMVRGFRRINPQMRADLERARSQELGRRSGIARTLREGVSPENRAGAIRSAQRGRLPELARFEEIRTSFDDSEFRALHQEIASKVDLPFNEANTHDALDKLLAGSVPTESELGLLESVFGPELRRAVQDVTKSRGRKAWELFIDFAGLPRGLLSSFDISAMMRQGGVLTVSHPRKALLGRNSAFARMIRSMASEDYARESLRRIRNDPDAQLLDNAGWFVRDIFETAPTAREEIFISRFVGRIPGVRASERAFSTYLNEITHKTAKSYISGLRREGLSDEAIRPGLERLATFLNVSTGRGTLGVAERSQLIREMSTVGFWSPRLLASRIQTPAEGLRALANINSADPAIRAASRQIAGDLAKYVSGMIGFLTILQISGLAKVETDPRSSDFGKIRVGNTRLDSWAGFQQIARYMAQLITGQTKSASTGDVTTLRDRSGVVGRFIRSKLAPGLPNLAASASPRFGGVTGAGENFIGESISPSDTREPGAFTEAVTLGRAEESNALLEEVVSQITPLMLQDINDAIKEQGLNGMLLSSANLIGIGSTSFGSPDAPPPLTPEEEDQSRNRFFNP